MAQENIFDLKGLKTFPSEFLVQPGALRDCENVVITRDGTIEARRGFEVHDNLSSVDIFGWSRITEYQDRLLLRAYDDTFFAYSNASFQSFLLLDNSNPFFGTEITPKSPDEEIRMREFQSNGNFYFTTLDGVKKLDVFSGPWYNAGMFCALGGTAALTGASGWFNFDAQVAYRVVWGFKDANENLILGPPSGRIEVVQNVGSSTTRDISLTINLPPEATTSHFFQVYRSPQSSDSSTPGNEEMGLVYEANPSAGEITAGEVTFTDSTPDTLRGATIYTAPSQEGLINSNFQPPQARDVTTYKNMALYANTRQRYSIGFTLIGVGAPSGLQDGDIITISRSTTDSFSYAFTAINDSGSPANNEFIVEEALTPAENIDATARNLVNAINDSTTNTEIFAIYESGFNDLPGKIRVFERHMATSSTIHPAFAVVVDANGGGWIPNLETSRNAEAEVAANRIYFSKPQQPESVPLLRFIEVGDRNHGIIRCIGLTDGVIVLKEDGVFGVYGETFESLVIQKLDNSAIIRGPSTAVVLNSRVFAFTKQGVVAISLNGVQIISRDIEDDVLAYLDNSSWTQFNESAHAVGYESERKYIFFTPTATSNLVSQEAFVYDLFTKSWTKWTKTDIMAAHVNTVDDKLYLMEQVDSGDADLLRERKDMADTDYADEEYAVTISAFDGVNVEFADATNVAAGQYLVQGANTSRIVSLGSGNEVQVADTITWSLAAATVYDPVEASVSFLPMFAKAPGAVKTFRDTLFFFRDSSVERFTASYHTDTNVTDDDNVINPTNFNSTVVNSESVPVPRPMMMARLLYVKIAHAEARVKFALSGVVVDYEAMSDRTQDQ